MATFIKQFQRFKDGFGRSYCISKHTFKFKRYDTLKFTKVNPQWPNSKYILICGIIKRNDWPRKIQERYLVKVSNSTIPTMISSHMLSSIKIDTVQKFYKLTLTNILKNL